MSTVINVPLDSSIKSLVESDSLTADQKTQAIRAAVAQCQADTLIEQLRILNLYMAELVGDKIEGTL